MSKGTIVNWETAQWALENMVIEKATLEAVCQLPKPKDVLFPERRSMTDVKMLCNKMGGNTTVVKSVADQDRLTEHFWNDLPSVSGDFGMQHMDNLW
jgi:hypothetical protein